METDDETITVSAGMPLALRVIFIVGALALSGLLVSELWRGVIPFNIFSPFFAFIMLGGLSVLSSFLLFSLSTPQVTWRFRRGWLEIEHELYGTVHRTQRAADTLHASVVRDETGEGTPSWHVVLGGTPSGFGTAPGLRDKIAMLFPRHREAMLHHGQMVSPGFSTREAAQRAYRHLTGAEAPE